MVTFTITDTKARTSTDSKAMLIDNPPTAAIALPTGSSPVIEQGGNIDIEGDDGIAVAESTHSYEWDFGNGGSSTDEDPGGRAHVFKYEP